MERLRTAMRVLLGSMSNMAANIVTSALLAAPDVVVAGRVGPDGDLITEICSAAADAVILHEGHGGDGHQTMTVLQRFPALKVVTISANGRSGILHELRLVTIRLEDLSVDLLQRALRGDLVATPS
jgi:hypothetical protein